MGVVLRRMTDAPIYLPPELLARDQPVRRKGASCTARWQSWRYSLGGGGYHSVSGSATSDIGDNDALPRDRGTQGENLDGGVMRVLCPGNDVRLKRSTIVLVVVWFSLSYGTYGVATWNNQLFADVGLSNPYLCSFIYSISTLPGNVGSILLVEQVSGLVYVPSCIYYVDTSFFRLVVSAIVVSGGVFSCTRVGFGYDGAEEMTHANGSPLSAPSLMYQLLTPEALVVLTPPHKTRTPTLTPLRRNTVFQGWPEIPIVSVNGAGGAGGNPFRSRIWVGGGCCRDRCMSF